MPESIIRQLNESDLDAMIDIASGAFPAFAVHTPEEREKQKSRMLKTQTEDPASSYYGIFRQGRLVGGMRLYDFTMNLLGTKVPAGGVGNVSVHLLHKKQKAAKALIQFYLEHYREKNAPLAILYPFRPDFYKRMGFGFGPPMFEYRISPAEFPRSTAGPGMRFLEEDDAQALARCYQRYTERTHGMIYRPKKYWADLFERKNIYKAGFFSNDALEGYMVFSFQKEENAPHPLRNNLKINEFVYLTSQALAGMLNFLHTQSDQVYRVLLSSQDLTFHFMASNPLDDRHLPMPYINQSIATAGIGMMYRVINVPGIFAHMKNTNFNNANLKLKITLEDSFLPSNAGSNVVHFQNGYGTVVESSDHQVEIKLDISDFSSLLVGSVRFNKLLQYGLVEISHPESASLINHIFDAAEPPVCMTAF